MPRLSRWLLTLATVGLFAPLLAVPATASGAYDDAIDLSFPVPDLDERHFLDDYHDPRGDGTRYHQATDIGDPNAYGLDVHAAVGGEVVFMTGVDSDVPSYGYMIRIAGDDGRRYSYIHLGRQDGGPDEAYAPGLTEGDRVARGQHIGYVGHSGNASASFPHLHLAIADPDVVDPYGDNIRNPYRSLVAALDGDAGHGDDTHTGGDGPHSPRFEDVPDDHPHAEAISAIAEAGITEGCTSARFCPTLAVTRGQMATFLQRALGLGDGGDLPFDDVPDDHPHRAAIAAVAEAGIARGDGDGRFRPDAPVRRDQMASLLAGALELEPRDEQPFEDVPPDSVHAGAIAALADEGIARGSGDGTYRPALSLERAQMASFLERSFLADDA